MGLIEALEHAVFTLLQKGGVFVYITVEQFFCFCFAIGLLLFIHLLMAVFDLIDCYQCRRKLPSLLAEEILKRTNVQA